MNIGERIKFFREKKKITVNKLANLSGVSQSYLRDLELNNKQPTVEYLSYICEALGITLEKFFSDNEKNDEISLIINNLNTEQKEALLKLTKKRWIAKNKLYDILDINRPRATTVQPVQKAQPERAQGLSVWLL